nr:helicase [Tanacetum cinerariifolium]
MELYMLNRPKKYSELSATEAIQADCDVKVINIILQGLPPEVYALVSTFQYSQYGTPYHSSQYASQAQLSTPLSITYPSNDFQSSVNHNVYNPSSSTPQVEYAPPVHQQSESILTDLQVTPTKPGRMTKPYSSHRFIANCFNARNLKIEVKRGLPHAHILLWFEEHSKCRTPSEIDDIISTELPSLTDDLVSYKVVTKYMLWPMWKRRKYAAYTNDGKCSKHFPKPFLAETFLDEEGYPHYRRRDNKVTIKKGKFTYDDKPVVPHNRYLLLKYNAHINVEWCNRSKAIKYLFKYLNKGPDRATIVIQENVKNGNTLTTEHVLEVDEIKNYLNCRFLAPCEEVWRLFSFDIHYSYPTVMKLSFYLPNQNIITLRDSENLPAQLQRE